MEMMILTCATAVVWDVKSHQTPGFGSSKQSKSFNCTWYMLLLAHAVYTARTIVIRTGGPFPCMSLRRTTKWIDLLCQCIFTGEEEWPDGCSVQDKASAGLQIFWHRAGWLVLLLLCQSSSSFILQRTSLVEKTYACKCWNRNCVRPFPILFVCESRCDFQTLSVFASTLAFPDMVWNLRIWDSRPSITIFEIFLRCHSSVLVYHVFSFWSCNKVSHRGFSSSHIPLWSTSWQCWLERVEMLAVKVLSWLWDDLLWRHLAPKNLTGWMPSRFDGSLDQRSLWVRNWLWYSLQLLSCVVRFSRLHGGSRSGSRCLLRVRDVNQPKPIVTLWLGECWKFHEKQVAKSQSTSNQKGLSWLQSDLQSPQQP